MKIASVAFEDNGTIPPDYTCDGENISPPLSIADVPEEAKSLVLIIDDPDAPEGIFTHWILFNIPPETEDIDEDDVPEGARQGLNSNDNAGYTGPCPPGGIHHYHFRLYALDNTLNFPSPPNKEDIEDAMEGRTIDQAELVGLYGT